ncbi:hypothetical protein SAY86_015282 [Trapa natans]|uniref:Uncharacterized protein n=1 Tax=Trapa natans TaxID=22666 RepID=A0AAN7KJM3_TRANT|nr:hypothetical protein SAY86_015282 [Trapa natans]
MSYHSNPDQLPVFYPPHRGYLPPPAYYPAVYPPAYAVYPPPYAFYPTAYPYAAYPPPLGMGWFPMAPSGPSPTPPQQNGSSLLSTIQDVQPENTYSICSFSYEQRLEVTTCIMEHTFIISFPQSLPSCHT